MLFYTNCLKLSVISNTQKVNENLIEWSDFNWIKRETKTKANKEKKEKRIGEKRKKGKKRGEKKS